MIDEIQALLPLFEKISDGAIWAFMVYMGVKLISTVIWPIAFVALLLSFRGTIIRLWAPRDQKEEVELYRLTYRGKKTNSYIGERSTLVKFMGCLKGQSEYSIGSGEYIYSDDLKKAAKKLGFEI